VEDPKLEYVEYTKPFKMRKVNIGMKDNPKFTNIKHYWNKETIEKIVDLLREYRDLFLNIFSKMKGIVGDIRELRTLLNPDTKIVKQRPYQLNLVYKKKFKEEIDRMLEAGIIEPDAVSEWIIPMVI